MFYYVWKNPQGDIVGHNQTPIPRSPPAISCTKEEFIKLGFYVSPPENLPTIDNLQAENKLLRSQLQAQTERSDFIEDCIAEMATIVYGGV